MYMILYTNYNNMYITHAAHTDARVPIGSQYKILYITLYGRGWEMLLLLLQCIRSKLGCPRAIRIRTHNNINRVCRFVKPREDPRR